MENSNASQRGYTGRENSTHAFVGESYFGSGPPARWFDERTEELGELIEDGSALAEVAFLAETKQLSVRPFFPVCI